MMQAIRFNGTLNLTVNGNPLKKGKEVDELKQQYAEQVAWLADDVVITVDRSDARKGEKETVRLDVGVSTHYFKKGDLAAKMSAAIAKAPQVLDSLKATGWLVSDEPYDSSVRQVYISGDGKLVRPPVLHKTARSTLAKTLKAEFSALSADFGEKTIAFDQRLAKASETDTALKTVGTGLDHGAKLALSNDFNRLFKFKVTEEMDDYFSTKTQTLTTPEGMYSLHQARNGQVHLEAGDYRRLDNPSQSVIDAFQACAKHITDTQSAAKKAYEDSGLRLKPLAN